MSTAESVKAKMKYRAKKQGIPVQDVFTIYILERVLFRLSTSKYKEMFVLKGGILLYGLFEGDFSRATTDIDLLGRSISNDSEMLKSVLTEILETPCDDPIRFDIQGMQATNITEFKKYHGVNITVDAYLDRTRIPVSIDFGFGDVIYPDRREIEYPTVLEDEPPILYAYSIESIIAEKLEAIVSLGYLNSRFKDFYDIVVLSNRFDFEGQDLREAIAETFEHRQTGYETIVAFEDNYAADPMRQSRWNGFLKKKKVREKISLQESIEMVRQFTMPVIEAIRRDEPLDSKWDHRSRE